MVPSESTRTSRVSSGDSSTLMESRSFGPIRYSPNPLLPVEERIVVVWPLRAVDGPVPLVLEVDGTCPSARPEISRIRTARRGKTTRAFRLSRKQTGRGKTRPEANSRRVGFPQEDRVTPTLSLRGDWNSVKTISARGVEQILAQYQNGTRRHNFPHAPAAALLPLPLVFPRSSALPALTLRSPISLVSVLHGG